MFFVFTAVLLFWPYTFAKAKPIPYSRDPKVPLVVRLPRYGFFQGTQVLTTLKYSIEFETPVDAWLGIDYATQPVGDKRFAAATWPEAFAGTKDADEYGPRCVQNGGMADQSEACLSFNLYRTPGVPLDQKLPVLLWVHGGAFVGGSGRSLDGAAFVAASTEPIVVVTMQYRLGALGFLPSALFEEEDLLNLGLRDQRLFLEFMQEYVEYFGGDTNKITLGGQSAGAHSVALHYFHNYDKDKGKPLFNQVIIASGAPTARSFPDAEYPLYKRQYEDFMTSVKCPLQPNDKALKCLRAVAIKDIHDASTHIMSKSNYNITWPWQPVSPGPLIEKRGSTSGEDGTFYHLPLLISTTTDEGKLFTPTNLTTNAEFISFLANLAPDLTPSDLKDLEKLYPDPTSGSGPYSKAPKSLEYDRISAAYGDYSYICPAQETARLVSNVSVSVYKARFNVPNYAPSWQGVPHASDLWYFNGLSSAQYSDIAELYHSYYVSFIVYGDPNKSSIDGAPTWEMYGGVGDGELVVGNADRGGTYMEKEGAGIRMEQCAWWRDPERMKRLNK
ncbi:Alpha/Beta hydrolase protein [Lophiotrema nucula]|uniref:Carboxylic ester hydrolase n=1 Tax=Lophiotrema nucula TaxID=690887 RepID=A0A6A5Z318_9PLEO|nr:Alpha/Beta hydrolase protein [Lophiotrema nucula]